MALAAEATRPGLLASFSARRAVGGSLCSEDPDGLDSVTGAAALLLAVLPRTRVPCSPKLGTCPECPFTTTSAPSRPRPLSFHPDAGTSGAVTCLPRCDPLLCFHHFYISPSTVRLFLKAFSCFLRVPFFQSRPLCGHHCSGPAHSDPCCLEVQPHPWAVRELLSGGSPPRSAVPWISAV